MHPRLRETLDSIETVAQQIQKDWERVDCLYPEFPEIVLKYTANIDLSIFSDLAIIIDLLNIPEFATLQRPSNFSDLYYKLYDNGKFWVEVLNWWGSDINIHDHDFAGVQFQVLGSSLNVKYNFIEKTTIGGIVFGVTEVAQAEIWEQGTRSIVVPGRGEPHNVSHLSEPTVSILFRTHPDPQYGPQRNYFPPHLAADYGIADITFRKRLKALRLLASDQNNEDRFVAAFRKVMQQQEPVQNLFTFIKMIDILFSPRYSHLAREFATANDLSARISETVAYFRATESLAKGLKYSAAHSIDEVICMSALSSCFNRRSFSQINNSLYSYNNKINLWKTLEEMIERIEGNDRKTLENIVTLFDLATQTEKPYLLG